MRCFMRNEPSWGKLDLCSVEKENPQFEIVKHVELVRNIVPGQVSGGNESIHRINLSL